MALSAKEMGEAIIRNLREKTGKTLEEWIAAIPAELGTDKKRVIAWLKGEQGLGHYQAVTVWERFMNHDAYADENAIVAHLFGERESALFQGYADARELILSLGEDITNIPCRTYIPFKRRRQFAIVTPHKGKLRLGFALEGGEIPAGLEVAKGMGGSERITYYVEYEPGSDIPKEARKALKLAYDQNG